MSKEEKRAEMLSMIADWLQSGKSKKEHYQEKGISEATFYYWLSRSKEENTSNGSFIAIDKTVKKNDIEIIYPNGVRINAGSDLVLLAQLIRLY